MKAMSRRLQTLRAPGGCFPLNGFELPGGIERLESCTEILREIFPGGIDLLIASICFQKISSQRDKAVGLTHELLKTVECHPQVESTVRVIAFLDVAVNGLAGLVAGLYRSTAIERNALNALLSARFNGVLPMPSGIKSPRQLAVKYFMHGNKFVRVFWVLLED